MLPTRRPGHATVVAYLALFIALGAGGAWAANKITSKQIAKNAVRAKHIKKNQVRAKHIKASQVRTKQIADGSVTAAKLLDGPGSGVDADALDGIGSGGFLASNRILYGGAPAAEDEALVFRWPGTGVEVRTHDVGAGDSITDTRVVNINPGGGPSFRVTSPAFGAAALGPSSSVNIGGFTGASVLLTENGGSLGRAMKLDCYSSVNSSSDDQLLRCIGVTARAP